MAQSVIDDSAAGHFAVPLEGTMAKLEYEVGHGRLILLHAETPVAFRRQGLAGLLVEAALAKARDEDLTIVPWCPYTRWWLQEHSEEIGDLRVDFAYRG